VVLRTSSQCTSWSRICGFVLTMNALHQAEMYKTKITDTVVLKIPI